MERENDWAMVEYQFWKSWKMFEVCKKALKAESTFNLQTLKNKIKHRWSRLKQEKGDRENVISLNSLRNKQMISVNMQSWKKDQTDMKGQNSYAKHEQSSHVRGPHITKLILSRHAEDYIALSQM